LDLFFMIAIRLLVESNCDRHRWICRLCFSRRWVSDSDDDGWRLLQRMQQRARRKQILSIMRR